MELILTSCICQEFWIFCQGFIFSHSGYDSFEYKNEGKKHHQYNNSFKEKNIHGFLELQISKPKTIMKFVGDFSCIMKYSSIRIRKTQNEHLIIV